MLQNRRNGFVLLDLLAAFSLFLLICLTLLPMFQIAKKTELNERIASTMLSSAYNELLYQLDKELILPFEKELTVKGTDGIFTIQEQNSIWEGCITWANVYHSEERKCFYVKKNLEK